MRARDVKPGYVAPSGDVVTLAYTIEDPLNTDESITVLHWSDGLITHGGANQTMVESAREDTR